MASTVLVPISLPEPDSPSDSLVNLLSEANVVVLGVNEVPVQTVPEQARENDAGESERRVAAIAERFSEAGSEVESKVVFTHDRRGAVDRLAKAEDCDVILVPNRAERTKWVLVPLRGDVNVERITAFVDDLTTDVLRKVCLLHVLESAESRADGEALLEKGRRQLIENGIDARSIDVELVDSGDVVGTIAERAKEYDTLVMGGTKPSLVDRIFGDVPHRISQKTGRPVFVVPPDT